MDSRLGDLLGRPSKFFAGAAARPSLLGPSLIAFALGTTMIVRLLGLLTVLGEVVDGFQGTPLVYAIGQFDVSAPQDLVAATLIIMLVFPVGWLLATAVMYPIARCFDGDGSFRALFSFVAWGQVPILVPALLSLSYTLYAVGQAPEITTEAAAMEWFERWYLDSLATRTLNYLDPIFAIWSSYLWFVAAEKGLDLTRRQALLCIALPAAAQIVNSIGGYFTISG